jgi:hypothetical protein
MRETVESCPKGGRAHGDLIAGDRCIDLARASGSDCLRQMHVRGDSVRFGAFNSRQAIPAIPLHGRALEGGALASHNRRIRREAQWHLPRRRGLPLLWY